MRCTAALVLVSLASGLRAQDPYWRTDSTGDPYRWSVGTELLRPVMDLLSQSEGTSYLRFEAFGQWWLRPDIAVRASVVLSDDSEVVEDPTQFTDSAAITRTTTEGARGWRTGAGLVFQRRRAVFVDRESRLAPLVGMTLLVGREDRTLRNEDQAYALDSSGVGAPIPGTAVVRTQEDRMLYVGLELAPGVSGRLGRRWEIEARLPLEVTWWSVLERTSVNSPTVPGWWEDPVNFGVRLPRLFLHYRW